MLDVIILSKDRAPELDLTLRSIKRFHTPGTDVNVSVIYTASTRAFDCGYEVVRSLHLDVHYICELDRDFRCDLEPGTAFRQLTRRAVLTNPEVVVLFDGAVVAEPLAGAVPGEPLAGAVPGEPLAGAVPGEPLAGVVPSAVVAEVLRAGCFGGVETLGAALRERLGTAAPPAPHDASTTETLNERLLVGERLRLDAADLTAPSSWEARAASRRRPPPVGGPRVSVVMPCYNCRDYVGAAIESVLAQTYRSFELIVVDDGSTDDSADIVQALIAAHPAVSMRLVRQRNSGACGYPRNVAIQSLATGEFVLCLDADDMLTPDFLARSVATLDEHPDRGFAYADYRCFGADDTLYALPEYSFELHRRRNIVGTASVFRRSTWEDVGGYYTHAPYEDWDFWLACGERGHLGVKVHGTEWLHLVRHDGLHARDIARDGLIKAHMVRRHASAFTGLQGDWAAAVIARETDYLGFSGDIPNDAELTAQRASANAVGGETTVAFEGVRSFVTVAVADEIVRTPQLMAEYAQHFGPADDATLVLYAPDYGTGDSASRVIGVVQELGLDTDDGPDMVLVALPAAEFDAAVQRSACAVLSDGDAPALLAHLPQYGAGAVPGLRTLAVRS
jgi:Glycosyl transferase family 2